MELHPILEESVMPNHSLWYVVSAFGDRPSLRVGHTSSPSYQQDEEEATKKVIFIGGANPSETFSDVHILDLQTLSWNMVNPPNFNPRYEHISYMPSSAPNKVHILAGANQTENISNDDVQCYDIETEQWSATIASGTPPPPRTHHTNAFIEDSVYIFSGGKVGSEPVQDRQVYCYNSSTNLWRSLDISGSSPSPRHGHTLTAISKKVYCFGGMAGSKFYNDLHILDLEKDTWITPKVKKRGLPEPRAAHAAVADGMNMFIFGGMNKEGSALCDLWKLDTVNMLWSQCQTEGPPPASRLDMASCVITWTTQGESSPTSAVDELADTMENVQVSAPEAAEGAAKEPSPVSQVCRLLLIHGGMDTQGEIFDDCLVYRLT
ncbi:rab9 effector protein with kelch motifs-like [Watersipora subatra]|uniref:rab9 effector protein with kelch motifs-like n=1 Tax=Watersipora subatra TaxID=2589382 RepID=UPI00355C6A27